MQSKNFQNFMTLDDAQKFFRSKQPRFGDTRRMAQIKRLKLGGKWKYRVYWWVGYQVHSDPSKLTSELPNGS